MCWFRHRVSFVVYLSLPSGFTQMLGTVPHQCHTMKEPWAADSVSSAEGTCRHPGKRRTRIVWDVLLELTAPHFWPVVHPGFTEESGAVSGSFVSSMWHPLSPCFFPESTLGAMCWPPALFLHRQVPFDLLDVFVSLEIKCSANSKLACVLISSASHPVTLPPVTNSDYQMLFP